MCSLQKEQRSVSSERYVPMNTKICIKVFMNESIINLSSSKTTQSQEENRDEKKVWNLSTEER